VTTQEDAIATLARTVGEALLKFATEYPKLTDAADPFASDEPLTLYDVEVPIGRGERQRQILELPDLAAEDGMKTSDVANEINYEVPNTHSTLQALERNGLVELVSGASPQRWRLAPRYRNTAPVFMRIASRVKHGEWTTYGDISIAVRGDTKAARGVASTAAKNLKFPHPERVLKEGGFISPNWVDSAGRGPDYCKQLLMDDDIDFDEEGRADPAKRVSWDELKRRDESEPVD
jgi:alkylated DNA nucleotide flippase Atl1